MHSGADNDLFMGICIVSVFHCLLNVHARVSGVYLCVFQKCLDRNPRSRPTVDDLLQHPFVAEGCI